MINSENYLRIKEKLDNNNVKLIAVSKKQPLEKIRELYDLGHRLLGENQAQAVVEKSQTLPGDINWQFIGHLQTNKVKYIAPFVDMIHSVDGYKLLKIINKEGAKNNRVINCLLQVHIADEDTKFGLNKEELNEVLNSDEVKKMNNINICGLMGMATFTDDRNKIRSEFRFIRKLFEETRRNYFVDNESFKELSIGMSDDYEIAVDEGSTMVRLGTLIFGQRVY